LFVVSSIGSFASAETDKWHPLPICPSQMEAQLLHRKRAGALDRLTQEQRRLHTAGMMLFAFCSAASSSCAAGASGAAAGGATGTSLVR
jgi:hypothetical protein